MTFLIPSLTELQPLLVPLASLFLACCHFQRLGRASPGSRRGAAVDTDCATSSAHAQSPTDLYAKCQDGETQDPRGVSGPSCCLSVRFITAETIRWLQAEEEKKKHNIKILWIQTAGRHVNQTLFSFIKRGKSDIWFRLEPKMRATVAGALSRSTAAVEKANTD